MTWVAGLLEVAPNDPLVLAGLLVALWVPVCAAGLLVLWSLAQTQEFFGHRRTPRARLVLPPTQVRPLAMRRYVTSGPRAGGGVVGLARVILVVVVVAGLTGVFLASNGSALLAALGR
jgi:hypothetical protein